MTTDALLWHAFREGDQNAYTELAHRYYRKLTHYGQKFTADNQLVEDAIQDLLIYLWLHRKTLNDTPSVHFYLLKAFRNQLFRVLKAYPLNAEPVDELIGWQSVHSVEELYIQQETTLGFQDKVAELLTQLPARQKEVIYLRFYQGLKPEEIGEMLTIQAQSVSNIIQRALLNLRERWPNALLSLSLHSLFYSSFITF